MNTNARNIIISNSENPQYNCDVIFRVYPNQDKHNQNSKCFFMFEVLTKSGIGGSEYAGRYSSEHPQAVRVMAQNVVDEFTSTRFVVMLSNEWPPVGEFARFHTWFKSAFESIVKGNRY